MLTFPPHTKSKDGAIIWDVDLDLLSNWLRNLNKVLIFLYCIVLTHCGFIVIIQSCRLSTG